VVGGASLAIGVAALFLDSPAAAIGLLGFGLLLIPTAVFEDPGRSRDRE
jgi:hypothetical protein